MSKRTFFTVLVVFALAVVFSWWIESKVERMAYQGDSDNLISQTTKRSLFDSIFRRSNESKTIGNSNEEDLTTDIPIAKPDTLSLKDLRLTTNETSTSLLVYGQQVAAILKPLETPRPDENELLLNFLEKNNEEARHKIFQAARVHSQIRKNLQTVTVPSSAGPLHLEITQRLARTSAYLANMNQAHRDPALAISNGLEYQLEALRLFTAIANLNNYFTTKNLRFTEDDRITIYVNIKEI